MVPPLIKADVSAPNSTFRPAAPGTHRDPLRRWAERSGYLLRAAGFVFFTAATDKKRGTTVRRARRENLERKKKILRTPFLCALGFIYRLIIQRFSPGRRLLCVSDLQWDVKQWASSVTHPASSSTLEITVKIASPSVGEKKNICVFRGGGGCRCLLAAPVSLLSVTLLCTYTTVYFHLQDDWNNCFDLQVST